MVRSYEGQKPHGKTQPKHSRSTAEAVPQGSAARQCLKAVLILRQRKSLLCALWCGVFLAVSMGSSLSAAEEESGGVEEALAWYKENFVLWKACHHELKSKLGENIKRDKAYCQRTIITLEKSQEMLNEQKKAALQTYIDKYKEIAGRLEKGRMSRLKIKRLKRTLDNLKREIEQKFSYKIVEIKHNLISKKETIDRKISRWGRVSPPAKKGKYRYVADRKSKTYHRIMCIYVSKIREENRVYFETKKEAGKSGRRACRRCTR